MNRGGTSVRRSGGGRTLRRIRKQNPKVVSLGNSTETPFGHRVVKGFKYYPKQKYNWPDFVLRKGCKSPLSADCLKLQMSPQWAIACFKPTYHRLRAIHGDNYEAIVDDLITTEAPGCSFGVPQTGAEHEFYRRIYLAVALLMNHEGVPVRYPPDSHSPRPQKADHISQPWLRALLTGWV